MGWTRCRTIDLTLDMPNSDTDSSPGLGSLLLALLLLAGWAALLLTPLLQSQDVGVVSLWDMRTLDAARASGGRMLLALALDALRFAPLGLLAVFAFRDRAIGLLRAVLVALPAFLLALLVSGLVLWLRDRSAGPPSVSDLLLPVAGVALGVLVGLASRRGLLALLWLPVKLAAALLLLAIVLVGLLLSALEPAATVPELREVSTSDKRRLVALFRGKDPRQIPVGQVRTLRLGNLDLERLVAWGLPLVHDPGRVRADALFEANDTVRLRGSLRVPGIGRWLNAVASVRAGVAGGRLWLETPRLRLGPRELPPGLLDALAPATAAALRGERHLRPALAALREVRIEDGAARATYGRMSAPRGLLSSLVWGESGSAALREPVAEQVKTALAAMAGGPEGDARTARAYTAAFSLARERAASGSALEENRAAILALGVLLGTDGLVPFAGDVVSAEQKKQASELRVKATLHGRADWTRHYAVSGALTVLSNEVPSNAAGLLKEELDADGGSGFSFGDLLADRAGTAFAALATRDEATAAAVQERIADGFVVGEFLPSASGLPEDVSDSELRSHYGGVGGPLYRKYVAEIERRLGSCPGLQPPREEPLQAVTQ